VTFIANVGKSFPEVLLAVFHVLYGRVN